MSTTINPEWKQLDFQNDVRPVQLTKLNRHKVQIAEVAKKMDDNNKQNLTQIDGVYKETAELESQFITTKMENMNLVNDCEMNGIKFLHEFAQNCRKTESLSDQIHSIKTIIAMLNNEVTLQELET